MSLSWRIEARQWVQRSDRAAGTADEIPALREAVRALIQQVEELEMRAPEVEAAPIEYEIRVTFLDGGEYMVQAAGVPYPVGLFKARAWGLDELLEGAQEAIMKHRNSRPR